MIAPLFHPRVLRKHHARFAFPQDLTDRYQQFLSLLQDARNSNNSLVYQQIVHDLFCHVLGYQSPFDNKDFWELDLNDRLVLGYFNNDRSQDQVEIKVAFMPSKIEFSTTIDWLIMTDFREITLYYRDHKIIFGQSFNFDEFTDRFQLELFYAIFCRRNLLGSPAHPNQSRVYELLDATENEEDKNGRDCYRYLSQLQQKLQKDLNYRLHHQSDQQQDLPQKITRIILYRLILLQGMTDRGLLPANLLQDAYNFHNPYISQPVWLNFRAVFRWLDEGNSLEQISPSAITFFEPDDTLDREIHIGDELCRQMKEISQFNFKDDIHPVLLSFLLFGILSKKKPNFRKWRTHRLIDQAALTWNYLNDRLNCLAFTELYQQQIIDPECNLGWRLLIAFLFLKLSYYRLSEQPMPTNQEIIKQLQGFARDQQTIDTVKVFFYLTIGIVPKLEVKPIEKNEQDPNLIYLA